MTTYLSDGTRVIGNKFQGAWVWHHIRQSILHVELVVLQNDLSDQFSNCGFNVLVALDGVAAEGREGVTRRIPAAAKRRFPARGGSAHNDIPFLSPRAY